MNHSEMLKLLIILLFNNSDLDFERKKFFVVFGGYFESWIGLHGSEKILILSTADTAPSDFIRIKFLLGLIYLRLSSKGEKILKTF